MKLYISGQENNPFVFPLTHQQQPALKLHFKCMRDSQKDLVEDIEIGNSSASIPELTDNGTVSPLVVSM